MLKSLLATGLLLCAAVPSSAAEPIVGKWRAPGGGIVQVTSCGGAYCAKVISGQHTGKTAGRMQGTDGDYSGTVTDPRDDRTYNGSAAVSGDTLQLRGCALKVFCKTQVWTRL